MSKYVLIMWGLASLTAGAPFTYADESATFRQVTVDSTVIGTLKPFNGATGAPGAEFSGNRGEAKIDVSEAYKNARIDLIRTHDAFGPSDIDAQFGAAKNLPVSIPAERNALNIFPDMSADANNPMSYNFGPTDRLIASIKGVGAETIFRIGRSIGADPTPPADSDKYAQIARHIVLHYNQGWNNGFHYGLPYYWEALWNEPDFRVFWTGTPQQYYDLYEKVAHAVKAAEPKALIGGPTISKPLDATPYREGFLDFVRAKKLPFGFPLFGGTTTRWIPTTRRRWSISGRKSARFLTPMDFSRRRTSWMSGTWTCSTATCRRPRVQRSRRQRLFTC